MAVNISGLNISVVWVLAPEALGFSPGWDDFLPPVTYGLSYNHKKKEEKIQLSLFYLADHLR